ncbi:MAG: hypothetical protein ABJF50_09040, partial [Paracoccaceae bacterium]
MTPAKTEKNNIRQAFGRAPSKGLFALTFGVFAAVTANPALSQESSFVRIELPDNNVSVEGELIEVDDDSYFIKGELGTLKVAREGAICVGFGCPDGNDDTETELAGRQVILKAIEGETQIKGELVDVDGQHYVVRNFLGEFRILKSDVECGGPACPNIEFYDPQFTIHGVTPEVRFMIADLLEGYASANDQDYEVDANAGVPETVRLFTKSDRELVAEVSLIIETSHDALQIMSENTPDISILDQQQFSSHLTVVENVNPENLDQALLAYDGQVIIGNRENPVRDLDVVEISRIWNGSVDSWKSFGGGDFPISVHMVNEIATTGSDARLWLSSVGGSDTSSILTHNTEAE